MAQPVLDRHQSACRVPAIGDGEIAGIIDVGDGPSLIVSVLDREIVMIRPGGAHIAIWERGAGGGARQGLNGILQISDGYDMAG